MWMMRRAWSSTLAIMFPPQCVGCGRPHETVCMHCIVRARKNLNSPSPFIISLFDFKEPIIRRAIHAIKYYHRRDLVDPLAHALAIEMRNIPHVDDYVLVPVPMPRMRKLLRGYNQAELIAEHIGQDLSLSVVPEMLVRTRSPTRQVRARTRTERLENQHKSFFAPKDLSNMRIILIDDVTTTGATLMEARRALLARNAEHVLAATLAH